jgi:hypothetical protein
LLLLHGSRTTLREMKLCAPSAAGVGPCRFVARVGRAPAASAHAVIYPISAMAKKQIDNKNQQYETYLHALHKVQ